MVDGADATDVDDPAWLEAVKVRHAHRQFRAILPAFICVVGVHLVATCLALVVFEEIASDKVLMRVVAAADVCGLTIATYVQMISDDAKAFRMLLRLNEVNTALMSLFCFAWAWHDRIGRAYGGAALHEEPPLMQRSVVQMWAHTDHDTMTAWAVGRVCFFAWMIGILENLLAFPPATRRRVVYIVALRLLDPSLISLGQPCQGVICLSSLILGDFFGVLVSRALLDMFVAQEKEKAALHDVARHAKEQQTQVENERREQLIRGAMAKGNCSPRGSRSRVCMGTPLCVIADT